MHAHSRGARSPPRHPVIAEAGREDAAVVGDRDSDRVFELAVAVSLLAEGREKVAVGSEFLDAVIVEVRDEHLPGPADGDSGDGRECRRCNSL
ncbi:Six-bladed beta-propeller domain-containing protein [Aromatoleum bremense]|nr:Six-bladed beta-propeller domain-containing protein [Aromatoleum bremense]